MKKIWKTLIISVSTLGLYFLIKSAFRFSEDLDKLMKTLFPRHYYEELNKKIRQDHHI